MVPAPLPNRYAVAKPNLALPLTPSQHHHSTTTAPPQHHYSATTAPSLHHHTTMAPSQHHHSIRHVAFKMPSEVVLESWALWALHRVE